MENDSLIENTHHTIFNSYFQQVLNYILQHCRLYINDMTGDVTPPWETYPPPKRGEQFKQLKRTIRFMCDVSLRHCRFNGVTPNEGEWQHPALVTNILESIIPYMEIRKIRVSDYQGPDNSPIAGLPQTFFQCPFRDWTARNECSNESYRQGKCSQTDFQRQHRQYAMFLCCMNRILVCATYYDDPTRECCAKMYT